MTGPVCVIITARNAAATIADAVRSALAEPEVSELVLIDDASQDDTAARAKSAAQGDDRLRILQETQNIGPAQARNHAIDASNAPFLAILDADDYLLPGRFAALLTAPAFDMVADNIVFVPDERPGIVTLSELPDVADHAFQALDLAEFIAGNIPAPGIARGELGFLKPMISRDFLDRHALRYDPALWLGEDYDLYVRMLAKGARFQLSRQLGYAARVRSNSLSGQHRTADLAALLRATQTHRGLRDLHPSEQRAMRAHRDHLRDRYLLRAFLDRKRDLGLLRALPFALTPPENFLPIAKGIARDKFGRHRHAQQASQPDRRYLLPIE